MDYKEFDSSVVSVLDYRKSLLPDLKRNSNGKINGNSYTWWRHQTEQALEEIGVHSGDAKDLTRMLSETYYYNH